MMMLFKGRDGRIEENNQFDDYTLTLDDAGKMVRMDTPTPNKVTIPSNNSEPFPVGIMIGLRQAGRGLTSIVPESEEVIISATSLDMVGQHTTSIIHKVGPNEWDFYREAI